MIGHVETHPQVDTMLSYLAFPESEMTFTLKETYRPSEVSLLAHRDANRSKTKRSRVSLSGTVIQPDAFVTWIQSPIVSYPHD